jgi:hypothetical protein
MLAKIPYHDVQIPSTSVKFLGWIVDTVSMTVSVTPERLKWIKKIITSTNETITPKFVKSIAGVLEFLASALPYLRAPMGWLQKRSSGLANGSEDCNKEFKIRFKRYLVYIQSLMQDWNGQAPIRDACKAETNPDTIIYADASGDIGYGALETTKLEYAFDLWRSDEIDQAMRVSSTSSTHLEILCICKAVITFVLPQTCARIHCDSQAAIFALKKRYCHSSDVVQSFIIGLDCWCQRNAVDLFFVHSPREDSLIRLVDSLSKGKVRIIIHFTW